MTGKIALKIERPETGDTQVGPGGVVLGGRLLLGKRRVSDLPRGESGYTGMYGTVGQGEIAPTFLELLPSA